MRASVWVQADQLKYARLGPGSKAGMRWHPTVIRWSLLMHAWCNSAGWQELQQILHLPSERRLRAYRSFGSVDGLSHEAMGR